MSGRLGESLLLALLFASCGFLVIWILTRHFVHYHAFYGMSKTRRRKIVKAQSCLSYVLMLYVVKYNYPKTTWFCLVLYWAQCIGVVFTSGIFFISAFIDVYLPPLFAILPAAVVVSPILLILLAGFLPKNRKRKSQDKL